MKSDYRGRFPVFDPRRIATYPVAGRRNRVHLCDLVPPTSVLAADGERLDAATSAAIESVAEAIVAARRADRPVVVFCGAHPIKNGLGLLLIDLIERGLVTLIASNGAGAIHDFELALIGETSEDVPDALPKGQFGMAYEFAFFNAAVNVGYAEGLGFGESLGCMIVDAEFRGRVLQSIKYKENPPPFTHHESSVLAAALRRNVPFTVHASVGTDVVDQHASCDAAAKGGTSGRDFLIFTEHITGLTEGGVIVNLSCAVTGPEVLLKAISMAANIGQRPSRIVTADFDLRPARPEAMGDESNVHYYYRDQKSIVTRIPQAFDGVGHYVQGDHRTTFPALYRSLAIRAFGRTEPLNP